MEERLLQRVLDALARDPKLVEKAKRKAELEDFKSKYNVVRATPLKCPACAALRQTPGSLWQNKDAKDVFTCRKCKITYRISTEPISTEELIIRLRAITRGDEDAVLQWDERLADA